MFLNPPERNPPGEKNILPPKFFFSPFLFKTKIESGGLTLASQTSPNLPKLPTTFKCKSKPQ